MKFTAKLLTHHARAIHFRGVSGSTKIDTTVRKAVRVLADHGIPTLVIGGMAVQEHGYPRFTKDGDLVVPNAGTAESILLNDGFQPTKYPGTVVDTNGVEIDLMQAGDRVNNSKIPLPHPTNLSGVPKFCDLHTLIELKVGSYLTLPFQRMQDSADVAKLIAANNVPREYLEGSAVEKTFLVLWDGLHQEKK